MGLLNNKCIKDIYLEQTNPKKTLIKFRNLGIKYILGNRREDIQSIIYNNLFRWRKKQAQNVFWALKDINFTGYTGDILGVIGSNGAGKTTLCKVIAGILRSDAGEVDIGGRVSALLSLGAGFNQELSGRENVFLNGMMLGFSQKECHDFLSQIINFSGLVRFIDQPVKYYSSGMRARLGFSIAVMVEPEILIVDEALSVGDLEFNERAAQKMQDIVKKASMVIVVTHQTDFVLKYCNRALWIDKGSVGAIGCPDEVVSLYRSLLTKVVKTKPVDINLHATKSYLGVNGVVDVNSLGIRFLLKKISKTENNKKFFIKELFDSKSQPFWALEDVNLKINEGDIVGVIGPNGAGKSTLCRVLTGILRADKGKVFVTGDTTALLSLGAGFNDQLTGRDNIFLNGLMLGIPKKKLKPLYKQIVEFSGLEKFMDRPLKQYSSGMRARLGFSIAVMIEPDVFIIDEALSVGDALFYEKASTKIQELIGRAKAVIIVTHNMAFVERVCTRALWMENGIIKFDGNPKEAVVEYKQSIMK